MTGLLIDGRRVDVAPGSTILAAARAAGIGIPTLCDDPRLEPTGACRLCLVEVAGHARLAAACATPVEEGMEVRTATPAIEAERRAVLEWLAADYPPTDPSASPRNVFAKYLQADGVAAQGAPRSAERIDESHPYLRVDMSRCIACFRCLRICHEVQGQDVWHLWDRGTETVIHPDGPSMRDSSCVGCGACVDACPSGALEDRQTFGAPAPTTWTRTTCPYCGVGCEIEYGTHDGRIVASRPAIDAPVNRGHACVKGRYAFGFVHAADRIVRPLVRRAGAWRDVAWSDALDEVAGRLARIIEHHGPDAVGVLGSARATNEDNYLIQKFARLVVGTNNVDSCARVCHAPSAAALKSMLGAGAATNSFDDIEAARTILVCGANATENHPVVGARIRQAARRGATLIVIDPRRTELAAEAAIHLAVRPGTNIPVLSAMARVTLDERLEDGGFVASCLDGLDEFRQSLAEWTPERAADISGVASDEIRRAARVYAMHRPAMCVHGLGLTEHTQGTDGVRALINLALLTGNLGTPGAGVNPLRGQNNVQGAGHMGCEPGSLTGGVALEDGRAAFEAAWGRPLPRTPGLKLLDMIDAAIDGRLKALIVVGYDILLTNPQTDRTRRALQSLDLLVVQDLFHTETSSLAHVFLPACSAFEKDGTFMNAERRVQRVRKVVEPAGESRTDGEIVRALAAAMGRGDLLASARAADVWDEIRQVWPGARGITYARLEHGGLQWPCPDEQHPGTRILYAGGFPRGRVRLAPIRFEPTTERTDDAYPFLLTTGRTLHQFNAGTMIARTPSLELRPADMLDLCPADAGAIGLAAGDHARVTSRYGEVVLPVRVTAMVPRGQAFATFHTPATPVNRVTSDRWDGVGTPEYKVTAVRIEQAGKSPAAAEEIRHGEPQTAFSADVRRRHALCSRSSGGKPRP
jgi:formate dehydrogenase major subunit